MNPLPQKAISDVLNSFVQVNEDELSIILERASFLTIPKKTKILELGKVCDKLYFILSGCIRLYYINNEGIERNCFFFHENLFCTAFSSFVNQRPSRRIMETLESTSCLMMTHQALETIYKEFPKMNLIVRKILEERYSNAHDIAASFILHSAEDRYLKFIDENPQLANRIPEYHLSSYLGITPKSFSRLKARLREKKRNLK